MVTNYTAESFAFLRKTKQQFIEEFNEIPNPQANGPDELSYILGFEGGLKPEAIIRNRYENIIANDATRVKLQGRGPNDDYINANYSLSGRVIISQGPLDDGDRGYMRHQEDFYDMIFHENVSSILMLTDYVEKGVMKCSDYLSVQKSSKKNGIKDGIFRKVGQYKVIVDQDDSPEAQALNQLHFKVSKIYLSQPGSKLRTVMHYHLTSWKDHGDLSGKTAFVAAKIILSNQNPLEKTLIHCSAGTGRSGTVVALARAIMMIQANQLSDRLVINALTAVRLDRRGLVQTVGQYMTIYDGVRSFAIEELGLHEIPPILIQSDSVQEISDEMAVATQPVPQEFREIRVKAKVPYPYSLSIRGNGADLNWSRGKPLEKIDDDTYVYRLEGTSGNVEYKILWDDRGWEMGYNHVIDTEKTQEVAPSFAFPRTPLIVDCETTNDLYVRGTGPGMSWEKGVLLTRVNGKYVLETDREIGDFVFKVLIEDIMYEDGEVHQVKKGETVVIQPNFNF